MKRLLIAACLLVGTFLPTHASEQRDMLQSLADRSQIQSLIVSNKEWIPYPAYTDRAGWDALTSTNKQALIAAGERLLNHDWPTVKATDYLEYERTGNRKIMEDIYQKNCNTLAVLITAELAEGKGRFIDQIINGSFYFCEMTSWALSAHTHSLQRPRTAVPIKDQHVIALVSCEMGAMLAWIDHFFGEQIAQESPIIAERIRTEVKERVIDTYMTRAADFWWTGVKHYPSNTINNWNPWCNCNVLQCMLLLEDDPEKLAEGVWRTMCSVDVFLNYVKSDGACEEGPAYWGHASGKLYDYLRVLHWASNGQLNLLGHKRIRDMGEYIARSYVGNGWVVNFADASAKSSAPETVIHRYGHDVGSEEMCGMAAYMVHSLGASVLGDGGSSDEWPRRDLLRRLESIAHHNDLMASTPKEPHYDYTWYPQTEFCFMRSDRIYLAAKGGHNNESHNHNDVGTFSLYIDNSPVLIDAGVGTYTRQTFSKDRYSIWTMQSGYHNLPTINGYTQKFGPTYRSRSAASDQKTMTFSLDIAGAYPEEAGVEKWQRKLTLKKNNSVVLTENFVLREATAPNQLHFLTWGELDLSQAGVVRITTPEGKQVAIRYNSRLFTPTVDTIPLTDPRLSNVWGSEIKRLTLTANTIARKGKYTVQIEAGK